MACERVVVVGLALKLAKAGQGRQADRLSVGRFVNPKAEPPVWSSAQELSAAAAAATALSVRPTQPTTSSKPAAVSQPAIQFTSGNWTEQWSTQLLGGQCSRVSI